MIMISLFEWGHLARPRDEPLLYSPSCQISSVCSSVIAAPIKSGPGLLLYLFISSTHSVYHCSTSRRYVRTKSKAVFACWPLTEGPPRPWREWYRSYFLSCNPTHPPTCYHCTTLTRLSVFLFPVWQASNNVLTCLHSVLRGWRGGTNKTTTKKMLLHVPMPIYVSFTFCPLHNYHFKMSKKMYSIMYEVFCLQWLFSSHYWYLGQKRDCSPWDPFSC